MQGVLDKPAPDVQLVSFEPSSILYELRVWTDDIAQAPQIASDLRARIWEEFRKEGIVIPYPIQTPGARPPGAPAAGGGRRGRREVAGAAVRGRGAGARPLAGARPEARR